MVVQYLYFSSTVICGVDARQFVVLDFMDWTEGISIELT